MNNAGLPGTGLGGFFYILMALLMPFYELYLTLLGRSSWARWKLVIYQLFIAAGILAGVEGAAWVAHKLFNFQKPTIEILGNALLVSHLFIAAPIFISMTILSLLIIGIRVWAYTNKVFSMNRNLEHLKTPE